ncbi:hypothetical protein EE612_039590 [Oryza sativa]|nr:hypothetical protein EE612_039590 [Oryza sativa]
MDLSPSAAASPSLAKAVETYRKAVATAATVTAYAVLAHGMARELVPHDLRAALSWAASLVRARVEPRPAERRTAIIRSIEGNGHGHAQCIESRFFVDAHAYLATKIDPRSMSRFFLGGGRRGRNVLSMVPGDSMTDVFEGVEFKWTSVPAEGRFADTEVSLELSFDAAHTDMALGRYVPFIKEEVEQARRRDRELMIFMNEGSSWRGIAHHHPATFDTLAMDPELKRSIVADLDRFLKRKEYYRRIGKAWKRGYLLHGPPGTGKSSLVAAMANYLRFNLYDLDLSEVHSNSALQRLLIGMTNRCILIIEDIDCCFRARSRENGKERKTPTPTNNDGDDDDDDEEGDDFSEKNDIVRAAQLHRRLVVDERRGEGHRVHHQLQGSPRRGAAPAGEDGHARLHGLLRLGRLQDARPQLLPRRRPPAVPGDTGAARRRGGDAGRGVGDAAAQRGRRRRAQWPRRVPRGEEGEEEEEAGHV